MHDPPPTASCPPRGRGLVDVPRRGRLDRHCRGRLGGHCRGRLGGHCRGRLGGHCRGRLDGTAAGGSIDTAAGGSIDTAAGGSICPSRIRTMRPAPAATSALWVTMRIVWPRRCSCRNSSSTSAAPSESSAPVGSSASSSVGRLASARAIATRWRWPPDNRAGSSPARSSMPSRSSSSCALASAACRRVPPTSAASATFSSAVRCSISWKNWNTSPTCRRRSRASAAELSSSSRTPASSMLPSSTGSSPASTCRSVDFPQPDCPIRATNSPCWTTRSTPRSARTGAVCASKVRRTPLATRSAPTLTPSTRRSQVHSPE